MKSILQVLKSTGFYDYDRDDWSQIRLMCCKWNLKLIEDHSGTCATFEISNHFAEEMHRGGSL